jgi:hypothetical protein
MHTWIHLISIKTIRHIDIIKDIKNELKCGTSEALHHFKQLNEMMISGEVFKDDALWYIVNKHYDTIPSTEQPPAICDYWALRKKQEAEHDALVAFHSDSARKWYDGLSDIEKFYIDIIRPTYSAPIA